MNLKTLKDFEFHKSAEGMGCCQECGYLQKDNDLRQEAIKWIKFYRIAIKEKKNYTKIYGCVEEDIIILKSKCEVLEDFFNIEESDL